MRCFRYLLIPFTILLIVAESAGQKRIGKALESDLFQEDSLLSISLTFNINATVRDIDVRNGHHALLRYKDEQGESDPIELKTKVRGNNRANPQVCQFPPLELNFKKKGNYDNLFAGQDKLKLVTHCNKPAVYENYVIQEYLTYKHYQVLTGHSFKVRMVKVDYIDSASQEVVYKRFGFLIENQDVMAARNGMEIKKDPIANQDVCRQDILDIMTVFQYMISNTDWSVTHLHNVKLMNVDSLKVLPIPVPYDFDNAGAVATHYAQANESLPIESVRQRLFRGFCRQPGTYERVFALFNEKKKDIYDVYRTSPYITEKNRKKTLKYFDQFYKTINDPKRARKEIIEACRVSHRHVY